MLMGNCISGASLTVNNLTTQILEGGQREIELYLSFGATGYESVSRLIRNAVKLGCTPLLNSLNVIGTFPRSPIVIFRMSRIIRLLI